MTYEQLQKNVKDTEDAYDYAVTIFMAAGYNNNHKEDIACATAYAAWYKARLKLTDYLKEL